MKRVNPKTGLPFKYGDVREDDFVFLKYRQVQKIKKNGFCAEIWLNPKAFTQNNKTTNDYKKKSRLSPEGRAIQLLGNAKRRAEKNNAIVSINKEWVQKKLEAGICELTGIPFNFSTQKTHSKNPYSPSLDRIDSTNKNYTFENTRVVLTCVNEALNEYGLETLKPIFKILSDL